MDNLLNTAQSIPNIGSFKDDGMRLFDAPALIKLFTPGDQWIWYVVEFDGADLCFGLVVGNVPELGYFRLSSLQWGWGLHSIDVIRDARYSPKTLRELLKKHVRLHIAER